MLIGEQTDRLGRARVDAQHVHSSGSYANLTTCRLPRRSHHFMLTTERAHTSRRLSAWVAVWLALIAIAGPRIAAQQEVRALWVVRTTLSSPAAIETMVKSARGAGFNTLLVQVRGRADAYYNGGFEPRP